MPNAKFISSADWASAPEVDVIDGENLFPQVPAGTYYPILSSTTSIVVVQLTAGAIVETTPNVGDTLTVSGSNATGSATFQWQKDGVDISGATSASYDTTSNTAGDYRRGISDGVQGPVYTAAVTVSAAAASAPTFTRIFDDSVDAAYNPGNAGPTFSSVDLSTIPVGEEVHLTVTWTGLGQTGLIATPTLGGTAMTPVPGFGNNGAAGGQASYAMMYRLARPAGTGILDIAIPLVSNVNCRGFAIFVDHVEGRTADVASAKSETALAEVTINTNANSTVIAVHVNKDGATSPISFTSVTPYGTDQITSYGQSGTAKAEDVASGTLNIVSNRPGDAVANALFALSVE